MFWPDAASRLIDRYSFSKFPKLEELSEPVRSFGIGKFGDVQIQELNIYNDGIIVTTKSNTSILDSFVDDLLEWSKNDLGIIPTILSKPQRHYQSQLIVKSNLDLASVIKPSIAVLNAVNKTWNKQFDSEFEFASFNLDCDSTKLSGTRKPHHFGIERRIGAAFEENIFFSMGPFKTDDHLALLTKIEALGVGAD